MRFRRGATAVLAVGALGAAGSVAIADEGNGHAIDTRADYTPFTQFTPLPSSLRALGRRVAAKPSHS